MYPIALKTIILGLVIISENSTPLSRGVYNRHFELAKELNHKGLSTRVVVSSFHHFLKKPYEVNKSLTRVSDEDGSNEAFVIRVKNYSNPHSFTRVFNWFWFTLQLFRYKNSISKRGDIILVSSPSLIPLIFALFMRILNRNKFFFEVRDIWPLTLIELGNKSKKNPLILLMRLLEYRGYKRAEGIISTLPYVDKHIKSVLDTDKINFKCIPQGFTQDILALRNPISDDYKNKYIPKQKFIVCYAGTVGLSNNLDAFVRCSSEMQEYEDIFFIVLGEGQYKPVFQEQTKHQNNIVFAPSVDKNQVQDFLDKVDVTYDSIMNKKIYEFGLSRNKWIDYMLAGKPILFSGNETGITMIPESGCGIILPPDNSIALKKKVLEFYKMEKSKLKDIGQKGRDYVIRNRNYSSLAEKLLEVIS